MDGLRLVWGLHWIPAYKENQLFFYLGSLNSGLNPSVSLVLLTGLYDAAVGCTLCTKERGRFSCFTAASQSMINYLCNFFWFSQVLMERNYLSIISLFIGSNNNNNNNNGLSSAMLCCKQSKKTLHTILMFDTIGAQWYKSDLFFSILCLKRKTNCRNTVIHRNRNLCHCPWLAWLNGNILLVWLFWILKDWINQLWRNS